MLSKKYFSISEVSILSGLATHKLRYIEKSDPNIKIIQMRGRRYYTQNDIEYIKKNYRPSPLSTPAQQNLNMDIVYRIDQLLSKFYKLAE